MHRSQQICTENCVIALKFGRCLSRSAPFIRDAQCSSLMIILHLVCCNICIYFKIYILSVYSLKIMKLGFWWVTLHKYNISKLLFAIRGVAYQVVRTMFKIKLHIDVSVQDCSNSIDNTLELLHLALNYGYETHMKFNLGRVYDDVMIWKRL